MRLLVPSWLFASLSTTREVAQREYTFSTGKEISMARYLLIETRNPLEGGEYSRDLERRGLREDELISGVKVIGREEFGKVVDQFDTVWNW
jgi:hypothetical protein